MSFEDRASFHKTLGHTSIWRRFSLIFNGEMPKHDISNFMDRTHKPFPPLVPENIENASEFAESVMKTIGVSEQYFYYARKIYSTMEFPYPIEVESKIKSLIKDFKEITPLQKQINEIRRKDLLASQITYLSTIFDISLVDVEKKYKRSRVLSDDDTRKAIINVISSLELDEFIDPKDIHILANYFKSKDEDVLSILKQYMNTSEETMFIEKLLALA